MHAAVRLILACLFVLAPPEPAHADLSFVQIVQGQSLSGRDGVFGKTWIEIRGANMRIVSGYARKVLPNKKSEDPRRVIQLIDVKKKSRLLVYPDEKSYARAPLADIDYGNRIAETLERGEPVWKLERVEYKRRKLSDRRKLLGVMCEHLVFEAEMELSNQSGRKSKAKLVQHAWIAPITGKLSKTVLDLIAFENSFVAAAGGRLTPLDHERYQVREAAAYLQVPEKQLLAVVGSVREMYRDLVGYPVASSVSWSHKDHVALSDLTPIPPKPEGPPAAAPKKRQDSTTMVRGRKNYLGRGQQRLRGRMGSKYPTAGAFQVIHWGGQERQINRMYAKTRRQFGGSRYSRPQIVPSRGDYGEGGSRYQEPSVYPRFESQLRKVLKMLIREQQGRGITTAEGKAPKKPGPKAAPGEPFYEIYTEIHGLETGAVVAPRTFKLPSSYKEISYEFARSTRKTR